jgi:hypothetical protein
VKAFRLLVNRSAIWADWDEELLAVEFQELSEADLDLSLTGFDPREIDDLLLLPNEDQRENAAPPLPSNPVSRPGDLWLCGRPPHRILCADATWLPPIVHPANGIYERFLFCFIPANTGEAGTGSPRVPAPGSRAIGK